jgi:uncharacterized membrane protein
LPDATSVFTHTLTNTGESTDTFAVTISSSSPTGWTYELQLPGNPPDDKLSLVPGEQATVTLTVTLPPTANAPDAGTEETAQLTVTPESDPTFAVTASNTVLVLLQPDFTFSEATQPSVNAFPGRTVVFTHTLTNQANGSDNFTITPDLDSELTIESIVPANPIEVERNGNEEIIVTARVANETPAGSLTIDLTAQTNSTPKPASVLRTDTVVVQEAAIPDLSDGYAQNADPGATVIFTHTLKNIGNKAGDFTVSSPTLPTDWSAEENDPNDCLMDLSVGAECEFGIIVEVAAEADAGPNNFQITVSSAEGGATITDTVNVNAVPGLEFTPDYTESTGKDADPGKTALFTHTLTNTGNGPDTFNITLDTDPGWSATVSPTIITNMARDTEVQVTVTVTAPTGVVAGTIGVVTATAISALDPNPQASVVDETTINEAPGAELIPDEQTQYELPQEDSPVTVTFVHELRNSGSIPLSYTLATVDDQADWTSTVAPTETEELAPGATIPISVSVTMPAGTERDTQNITRVEVRERGGPDTLLAQAEDTTLARTQTGVLLEPPINYGSALPGKTRAYTHTVTNIGTDTDIFIFSTINNFGWETSVAPSSIDLAASESSIITVTVRIPTVALSNTVSLPPNIATIIARSSVDPTVTESAKNIPPCSSLPGFRSRRDSLIRSHRAVTLLRSGIPC